MIAQPWQDTPDYRAYLDAQVEKTRRRQGFIVPRTQALVKLLRYVDVRPPRGRSVLCVGARNLFELSVLAAAGFDPVLGIDLYAPRPPLLAMDMHALTFPDQSFDVVFACHVLEHAYDVPRVLGEWARVTKPGGTWAVEVPALFTPTAVDRHDFQSADGLMAAVAPYLARVLYVSQGHAPRANMVRVVGVTHG